MNDNQKVVNENKGLYITFRELLLAEQFKQEIECNFQKANMAKRSLEHYDRLLELHGVEEVR